MKKKLVLLTIGLASMGLYAQKIEVTNVRKLDVPLIEYPAHAKFNPEGDKITYTSTNYTGLYLFDLTTLQQRMLSEKKGAGYGVDFYNADIYFKEDSIANGRRYKQFKKFVAAQKIIKPISSPQRDMKEIQKIDESLKSKKSTLSVYGENLQIIIDRNGSKEIFDPIKDNSGYIWVSLSPSEDKVLFTALSKGTFVCNLDGSELIELGNLNAPSWYNKDYIIGMNDIDDGENILTSTIVMKHLQTISEFLVSDSSQKAFYPAVSQSTGQVAYHTEKGNIYIMNIICK